MLSKLISALFLYAGVCTQCRGDHLRTVGCTEADSNVQDPGLASTSHPGPQIHAFMLCGVRKGNSRPTTVTNCYRRIGTIVCCPCPSRKIPRGSHSWGKFFFARVWISLLISKGQDVCITCFVIVVIIHWSLEQIREGGRGVIVAWCNGHNVGSHTNLHRLNKIGIR